MESVMSSSIETDLENFEIDTCIRCSEGKEGKTVAFHFLKFNNYRVNKFKSENVHLCRDCKEVVISESESWARWGTGCSSLLLIVLAVATGFIIFNDFFRTVSAYPTVFVYCGAPVLALVSFMWLSSAGKELEEFEGTDEDYAKAIKKHLGKDYHFSSNEGVKVWEKRYEEMSYAKSNLFCENCEKKVPVYTEVGDKCPNCSVRFGGKTYINR